jgi:hypothetical protein
MKMLKMQRALILLAVTLTFLSGDMLTARPRGRISPRGPEVGRYGYIVYVTQKPVLHKNIGQWEFKFSLESPMSTNGVKTAFLPENPSDKFFVGPGNTKLSQEEKTLRITSARGVTVSRVVLSVNKWLKTTNEVFFVNWIGYQFKEW